MPHSPVPIAASAVIERIRYANQGRDAELLPMKYRAMRATPFAFLRGTAHLFYEDWPAMCPLDSAPLVWVCGDLHLENFGTFKGDNRLAYFDVNDFDGAALAPCTWELARFLTSVLVGARALGVHDRDARALGIHFLDAYTAALREGKARWVERAVAVGMVRDLLDVIERRSQRDLLRKRTDGTGGRRRLCICVDEVRALPVSDSQRAKVTALMQVFAARQADPAYYSVLDIARRIAGTGSLGIERYVLLVKGRGAPDGHAVLDLKQALPPVLPLTSGTVQPAWRSEAERIVAVQRRVQAVAPACLHAVTLEDRSYVLRELQPAEARLRLELWGGKPRRLERVLRTMGAIVAWGQLRSGGRQGSAIADELIAFAHDERWREPLVAYAEAYSRRVDHDWRAFRVAFDGGGIA